MQYDKRLHVQATRRKMRYAMLVLLGILGGLQFPASVKAIFPYDAVFGGMLRIIYGPEGPRHEAHITQVMNRTTGDIIKHHGYPYEEHVITTDDGYVLTMHRIPSKKNGRSKTVPIILVPGVLAASGCFVLNGAENSPAFIFWNAGYDVWLHNNRGTRYGRKHTTLSPDFQKEFWNFSFHEMGIYDLPAAIDYVTSNTESKQVYLLGHSMGGTLTAIFLAEKLDYSGKVKAAFLLAPAIYNRGTKFILVHELQFLFKIFMFLMDHTEVLPHNRKFHLLLGSFITMDSLGQRLNQLISHVIGNNITQERFLEAVSTSLSGTSVKVLRHFLQLANQDGFAKFDYGAERNMEAYGTEKPSEYKLGDIQVPVSLFYGDGDLVVVSKDVIRVGHQFKHLVSMRRVGDETFSHGHYIMSKDVKLQLYDTILVQMSTLEANVPTPKTAADTIHLLIILVIFLAAISQLLFGLRKLTNRHK